MIQRFTQKVLLVMFVGLLSFQVQGQGMKERVADKYYNVLSYFKAAEMYSELADKRNATDKQIRRAAECYRFIGDSENSEKYYGKLVSHSGVIAYDFYNYAQMLKMNEKYEEADNAMATFGSKASGNSIAKSHQENTDYLTKLKSTPNKYSIEIFDVNTTASDFGPTYYTIDGQTNIVFSSARSASSGLLNKDFQWDGSNFLDVYQSSLGVDGESTGVSKFNQGIKSKYHEGPVSFSNNGQTMYLTRSNYLNKKKGRDSARHNNLKLYIASADSNGKWSDLVEFPYNSDYYSLGHATVTEDGKIMYFSSDMPGGKGVTDIWMSKNIEGNWSKPVNVADVNTEGRDMFPFIAEDGTLYFSTDGYAGLGGLDVYRAAKSGEGSFSTPENMMFPLNTNHDDFGLIINQGQTHGYFSSNRGGDGSVGNDDIYRFKVELPSKPEEPKKPELYAVNGCAKTQNEEVIVNTTVELKNIQTGEVIKKILSEDGCYEFKDLTQGKYQITANKDKWSSVSDYKFNTDDSNGKNIENANVYLEESKYAVVGEIKDTESSESLSGVVVKMKNKNSGAIETFVTDKNGGITDGLERLPSLDEDYEVELVKEGYFTKKLDLKTIINKERAIDLSAFELKKASVGSTVGSFCHIDDILYDLNKSFIRPDAAAELNKLVKCMNENPDMVIEIGAHTDCRGSKRYNEKLSDRRAKSARDYVVSKGIDSKRIYGKGYGETKLLNRCACEPSNKSDCSEEEHQLNRRTEFKIVSGGKNVKNNSTNSF